MEASFVEPKQKCAGTPSIKSVGVVISPPPPAIESMHPAIKKARQQMRIKVRVTSRV